MINPICLPPRDLRKRTTHCTQQGQGCCHRQPNLSAWPGLVAPRPSSLLRPWVPPPPPSRSAHRPGCQSAPPAQPRPRARHCREARRPEVSSQADVALAPWPVGRRRDSLRRAWESRARQPVSLHPESFLGREVARCFAAAVKRGGGRSGRGLHGGRPAAYRRAVGGAPVLGAHAAEHWACPGAGSAQCHCRALWGGGLGHPGGLRGPQLRQADGPLRAAGKSVLAGPPSVCPSRCTHAPFFLLPSLLHFPALGLSFYFYHPWQLFLSPVLSTPGPDPITARFDHKPPNLRNTPIALHPKPIASTWCIFTCLTKFFLIPKSLGFWPLRLFSLLLSNVPPPLFGKDGTWQFLMRNTLTASTICSVHLVFLLLRSTSLWRHCAFLRTKPTTAHTSIFLLLTTDLILKLQTTVAWSVEYIWTFLTLVTAEFSTAHHCSFAHHF